MSIELFEKFIKEQDLSIKPVKSKQATRTAQEAAQAHGVPVSNIVKSLVIKADKDFFLVLCPGDKRVSLQQLKIVLDKKEIRMANADEVKEITGHSVGGVPPFGHKQSLKTIILKGFNPNEPLWAAAGRADTNFQTTLTELKKIIEKADITLFQI